MVAFRKFIKQRQGNMDIQTAKHILDALEQAYPDATTALIYENPFELLISTILSAQCTDRQVNLVTEKLFDLFPAPADFAKLEPEELEPHIKSCGFYIVKARHIVLACRMLLGKFGGEVPRTMEELTTLPGVGRKTANVVLSNAFGVDAIAVDTHVFRVANRLGLAQAKTPEETEKQLMKNIPQEKWSRAHHWIIRHGRQVCHARKPECADCPLVEWCEYTEKSC
jgi:endonuclease-3